MTAVAMCSGDIVICDGWQCVVVVRVVAMCGGSGGNVWRQWWQCVAVVVWRQWWQCVAAVVAMCGGSDSDGNV